MSAFTVTEKKVTTHTTTIDRIKLTKMFADLGYPIPFDARITMQVPSGGDYSGMTLDIDDMPLHIEYTTVE